MAPKPWRARTAETALRGRPAFAPFAVYATALLYLPMMWRALTEPERGRDEDAADGGERGWPSTLAAVVALTDLTFISFYLVPTQAPFYLATMGLCGAVHGGAGAGCGDAVVGGATSPRASTSALATVETCTSSAR